MANSEHSKDNIVRPLAATVAPQGAHPPVLPDYASKEINLSNAYNTTATRYSYTTVYATLFSPAA